ncbi:manganese-dependent inorganic pyrophosphatase [Bombilactobacillus thymidiniphilus]|uniref:inorganic diphosphatase n=1 Tax=Bombilactobacillus thymidiniphilus TaxID=2923363 RepID=A0ABY4PDT2_9LACO|nr:manganese-dependent inorganic pyrophosphatase [Bombilactobacillus thymidiniphilus]UQS83692.1 manganese-dependent inorganic pyrophosphatase [Bombilactobacillus thymidiniphilus]
MSKELVFGHQNPDTDAIVAAIALANLQNKLGKDVEAVALGELNDETKFVLDHFDQKAPRIIENAAPEVTAVMLVDHNEAQQSVADIANVTVTNVVDHHRIANFETVAPLYYRAEPVGCTSTILWEMYNEKQITISAQLAGLMLSAIISDTLLLQSPTTTEQDKTAVRALAEIAGEDYQAYGLQMLKAGANIADKTAEDLIDEDAKTFEMSTAQVRIAQINVVDLPEAVARKNEFVQAMNNSSTNNNYDLFLLAITNVLNSETTLLAVGEHTLLAKAEQAFGKQLNDNLMELPGVVSRKKQIVPPLQEQF